MICVFIQGRWWEKDERLALNMLPHVNSDVLSVLKDRGIVTGHDLLSSSADHVRGALRTVIGPPQVTEFLQVCNQYFKLLGALFGRFLDCISVSANSLRLQNSLFILPGHSFANFYHQRR
jgi:hypothetical protein